MRPWTVPAGSVWDGDTILWDARAAFVVQATWKWRYGVRYRRIVYRDAFGHCRQRDFESLEPVRVLVWSTR